MVKLLKHELIALFRVLVFLAAAVVVFAALGRIMLAVNLRQAEEGGGSLLSLLVIFLYAVAIVALIVTAWALGISRFYKTLFTGEGYMTLSLPVSPTGVICAKLLSSIIAMFASCIVSALSLCILFIGLPSELLTQLGNVLGEAVDMWADGIIAQPGLFIEGLIELIVSIPVSLLVIYTCISLGQLFTNHRKLMTFVIIIGLYIVWQILSVYAVAPIMLQAYETSVHLYNWIEILFIAGVDVGCFFLIRYILKNKINLIV